MFSSLNSSPSPSSASLLPEDRSRRPGKSMPMMDTFTDFSMVGVYKTKGELKFVHVKSEKFAGRFTILIFMDDKLSDMEIKEWEDFSNHIKDFKQVGASVVGVCTDSHISMRTMLMSSLQGVSFPIISDRDGDFSRAFGVLKVKDGKFGAARALVILDPEGRMVYMTLHSERTRSYPNKVVELIKHFNGEAKDVKKLSHDSRSGSSALTNSTSLSSKDSSSKVMSVSSMSSKSKEDNTEKETEATGEIIENISNDSSSSKEANGEKKIIYKFKEEGDKKTMDEKTPIVSSKKDEEVDNEKKDDTTKSFDNKVENKKIVDDKKNSDAKKPSVVKKPSDAKRSSDAKKPSVIRKPSNAKKPADVKKSADVKKPTDDRKLSTAKKADLTPTKNVKDKKGAIKKSAKK